MYIGIDVGTSGVKALAVDYQGTVLAEHSVSYELSAPREGWAEQNPRDWLDAAVSCIAKLTETEKCAGISFSGQMHGLVLLDDEAVVLRPAIIWCDQRTSKEAAELTELIGAERLAEITGSQAMTGFTAAKILWVKNNEPEIWAKTRHILLPKDYVRLMLTGIVSTEPSDAAGTQLFDINSLDWSDEILEKLGIPRKLLPEIMRSNAETGRYGDIRVFSGGADNACGAIGVGVTKPGSAMLSIGTSGVILAPVDRAVTDPRGRIHTLCSALPGQRMLMSCTQSAALSVKWFTELCGDIDYDDIPDSTNVVFLPYLNGERSPHPDPNAKGVFFGLTANTTRGEMLRAVYEGVAFSQRECLDVFRELGVEITSLTATGGGAKNRKWLQIFADILGAAIEAPELDQGAAYGAALLAIDNGQLIIDNERTVYVPDSTADYTRKYELYKELYVKLKTTFERLG
ncbi:MAG: xylulokinase [Oscillospiraceae bacterium]|jgi:xylulokinase|nr:xylulokinase [Oscillospiraceae bacterium]